MLAYMALDDLIVYYRGGFSRYGDAKVGLLTHALNYGTGCFEGIRAFWNPEQEELWILEPTAHFRRLASSSKVLLMDLPHSPEDLAQIAAELCRRNDFRSDAYLRPVAFKSEETFGVRLDDLEHDFFIVGFPNGTYLEKSGGITACISSWRRVDDNAAPARAKITGGYVNPALAKSEAERAIDRTELYSADELILCGTGIGIAWIRSLDHRIVGDGLIGPVAAAVLRVYDDLVRGRNRSYDVERFPTYGVRGSRNAARNVLYA